MLGLGQLVAEASLPHECAERRLARQFLVLVVAAWATVVLGPVLLALALQMGGHHGR